MRTMLLSFKPYVYDKIASGEKIFEHRRSFPDEPIKAYMYVSSPVCAIKGILYLGKRHKLEDWKEEFAYDQDAVARIEEFIESANYAAEILEFQETNAILLNTLRSSVKKFVVPQMYYFLEERELLWYLEDNLLKTGNVVKHYFDEIESTKICRH